MEKKIAVITGANSGFGLAMSLEFAKGDFLVMATMRNLQKGKVLLDKAKQLGIDTNITLVELDITSEDSVKQLQSSINNIGRVDILINNAGYAGAGFAEEVSQQEYQEQLNTNFFGTIRVTQSILPLMRKQGYGKIINISSISGLVGFPGLSPYVSSKYALEGWSEVLRLELLPFSIKVVLIEPSSFRTNIWTSGKKIASQSQSASSPYYNYLNKLESYLEKSSKNYGDPTTVAKKVYTIAQKEYPKLRYSVGNVKSMILLKALLPWKWWEKLVLFLLKI